MITTTIFGRLTADVEVQTKGETKYGKFTVASSHYNSKTKEYESDFMNCIAFGKTAEYLEKHSKKGAQVVVSGDLESYHGQKDPKAVYWTLRANKVELCYTPKAETKKEEPTDGDDDYPF